jgi:carboxymethylenebutenolidase
MPRQTIPISTPDGRCPTTVVTPEGWKAGPAVVFFMDAGGIRPTVFEMAQRLADAGYLVLVPDLYYRYGSYGPFDPVEILRGDFRAVLGPLMATTSNTKAARDTAALLAYLDTRPDVEGQEVGAVGFCMGGGMAIVAAGTYPDRFAAVASFHGGNLATDAPDSPHRFAPQLEARLYIAGATDDASYPPDMAERLGTALREANVLFQAETYPAAHGWMKPDFPVFDAVAAEQGWRAMLAFLNRELRHGVEP